MTGETTLYMPAPAAPCPECCEAPKHNDGEFLVCWCPHNGAGGIYQVESGIWQSFSTFPDERAFRRGIHAFFSGQLRRRKR